VTEPDLSAGWRPIGELTADRPADPQPEPAADTTPWTRRAAAAGHWMRDSGLGITGFILVLAVAIAGWSASFIGLHTFGVGHMSLSHRAAWLVPATLDGAPAGLSLVVFRASIHGRNATLWRLLIVAFTGLSSWVNYEHITDPTGRWVASVMPPAAVILFEGLMSEARAAAKRRAGGTVRPRFHPLRWAFDWSGTWGLVRNYVLGSELPSEFRTEPTAQDPEPETVPEPVRPVRTICFGSLNLMLLNPVEDPNQEPEKQKVPELDQPNQEPRTPRTPNLGDRAAKRTQQVQQVLNLITELGYDAVTLPVVQNRTGMSKTTAYHRLTEARAKWNEDAA
jgi:hypothetical protein